MTQGVTLIVPFYNQHYMLMEQINNWMQYGEATDFFDFIIVDDGSEKPATEHMTVAQHSWCMRNQVKIFRIREDIPWNRGEARNIGAKEALTNWIFHMDTDHVLAPDPAKNFARWASELYVADMYEWFRFRRFRIGAADHTRNKDKIPREAAHGEIKPHIDSYLCTKSLYWRVGGYDLDYSGCLGGGSPFLAQMTAVSEPRQAPDSVYLNCYTTNAVKDASADLDRDTSEYKRRKAEKQRLGFTKSINPVRRSYGRIL